VKIAPAYLGLAASQTEEVKKRHPISKRIWMDQQGMRIPVSQMTDYHLCATIRKMRWWAKRTREWLKHAIWWDVKEWLRENDELWLDDGSPSQEGFEILVGEMLRVKEIAELSNENFLRKYIPTWPELIQEGKRRGLYNQRGYRTNKIPRVE
jgi:hypothetical protein